MLLHSLFICSLTVVLVCGQRYSKSIAMQPRLSYATNVVHQYPGGSDQQAESSIKVDFHGSQGFGREKNMPTSSRASFSNEPSNPNLFNVGYDLSFKGTNDYRPKKEHRYTNVDIKKFENAEVITGRMKQNEKVRAPNFGSEQTPQEFVSQAVSKQKLLAAGGARYAMTSNTARYAAPIREQFSKFPSQSPSFTYNTQQNIFKDVVKATRPDPIQLSPELRASYEANNKWNNIYPANGKEGRDSDRQPLANFNHNFALKNSESFDFSNAHGDITFGDKSQAADSFAAGSEQRHNIHVPSAANDLNNLNIEAHIPKNLRGVKPLPLDTSLLKDPVLTTSPNQEPVPKHARVIPIHFDIRPLKNVMAQGQNYENYGYQQQNGPASSTESLSYESHGSASGNANLRMYGNAEPNAKNQFQAGLVYGNKPSNYGEDIYKIVSMRPPPIAQNFRY